MSDFIAASEPIPLLRLAYSDEDVEWIVSEMRAVLRSGFLTMGERVHRFEREFAAFCGSSRAIGTSGGTGALEMALRAVDVAGGVVLVPSNTYMATPLAAIHAGAKVRFVECRREHLQMDADDLARKLDDRVRAVVLVHIAGIVSPELDRIAALCRDAGVPLIEDAAHAHGAEWKGRRAGTFGAAGAFSFYPTKVLTTGEGGMLTTDDERIYTRAVKLREHGKDDPELNRHTELGSNWCMSEVSAVLGLEQMRRADQIVGERRRLAAVYDRLLEGNQTMTPVSQSPDGRPSFYKYVVYPKRRVDRRQLKQKLRAQGIALVGEVYEYPCHSQPVFDQHPELVVRDEDTFPITDEVCATHICLPLYPGLRDDEAARVVAAVTTELAKP